MMPALAGFILAGACSSSDGPSGATSGPRQGVVAALRVRTGGGQIGVVGDTLAEPITVAAYDAAGNTLSGVAITFTVSQGSGSVTSATATTGSNGTATTRWVLGTVAGEPQTLSAATSAGAAAVSVNVLASASAGAPTLIGATPASLTVEAGEVLPPIAVQLRDRFGNAATLPGARVTARVDSIAGVSLSGLTERQPDAFGRFSFAGLSLTGRAGIGRLLIESTGLKAARISLTLKPAAPARLTFVSSTIDAIFGGEGPPLAVRVFDAYDNVVPGVSVKFAIDGGATLGTSTTDADGLATLRAWAVPAPGSYRLIATASGSTASAVGALKSRLGAAAKLIVDPTNPTTVQVTLAVALRLKVVDAFDNPVPGQTVSLASATAGVAPAVTTDDAGIAIVDVTAGKKAGVNVITARAGDAAAELTVTGTPGHVWSAKGTDLEAPVGTTVTITFMTFDFWGNPTPNATLIPRALASFTIYPAVTSNADAILKFQVQLPTTPGRYIYDVTHPGPGENDFTGFVGEVAVRATLPMETLAIGAGSQRGVDPFGFIPIRALRSGLDGSPTRPRTPASASGAAP